MSSHTQLYDILGVDPSASTSQIKKAYMKLARKYHPDRNPDPEAAEKMKEISAAWDVLQDDEKRSMYDRYGMEGLQGMGDGGGGGFGGFGDIFDIFRGRSAQGPPTRTPDQKHAVGVGLEDLYNGKEKHLRLTRQVVCADCGGGGGKNGKSAEKCTECNGMGAKIVTRQIGPGMMQQMQMMCDKCRGQGECLDDADRCDTCHGDKVVERAEEVLLQIRPGMKHGEPVVIHGKANEAPGLDAGDLIFVVQETEHDTFERVNDDLYIKKTITLTEALCGFQFNIVTLDNRTLVVKSRPGEIIKPGDKKGIPDEGMPRNDNPALKGALFVVFEIEFPDTPFAEEDLETLRSVLPPAPTPPTPPADHEVVTLSVNIAAASQGSRAYHEDEHGGGQGGVQCAQA